MAPNICRGNSVPQILWVIQGNIEGKLQGNQEGIPPPQTSPRIFCLSSDKGVDMNLHRVKSRIVVLINLEDRIFHKIKRLAPVIHESSLHLFFNSIIKHKNILQQGNCKKLLLQCHPCHWLSHHCSPLPGRPRHWEGIIMAHKENTLRPQEVPQSLGQHDIESLPLNGTLPYQARPLYIFSPQL